MGITLAAPSDLGIAFAPSERFANRAEKPNCRKEPYKIQALDRAVSLLQVLRNSSNPLLLTEIAIRTGLHKSTTQRFLRILQGYDLVHRKTDGRYHLGLRLHDYGEQALQQFDPRDKTSAPFRRLLHEVNETGLLCVLRGDSIVCLDTFAPLESASASCRTEASSLIHATAAGKVILAFTAPMVRDAMIARIAFVRSNPNTHTNARTLCEDLEQIRQCGYAVDDEESGKGSRSVATPIFNREGLPVAALSISGPTFRITPEKVQSLGRQLIACCREISCDMGYAR